MSLSDCPRCWDTPCGCGYQYLLWSQTAIDNHINMLAKIKQFKIENKYSKMTP